MTIIKKYLEINPVNPTYQRDPNRGLSKLADSITKYGILSFPVCCKQLLSDGTFRYILVDGLHRVEAARLTNTLDTLECIVSPYVCHSNLEVVALMRTLNNTQTPWTLSTYIHFYASCGESNAKSYQILEERKYSTRIPFSVMSVLLSGIESRICSKIIKNGEFTIPNLELSNRVIKAFREFIVWYPNKISTDIQRDIALKIYEYCHEVNDFMPVRFNQYLKTQNYEIK